MKKKNGLEKKVSNKCNVIKLPRHKAQGELYLPYCTLAFHMGPIKDPEKCTRNKCIYYTQLFLALGEKPYAD